VGAWQWFLISNRRRRGFSTSAAAAVFNCWSSAYRAACRSASTPQIIRTTRHPEERVFHLTADNCYRVSRMDRFGLFVGNVEPEVTTRANEDESERDIWRRE